MCNMNLAESNWKLLNYQATRLHYWLQKSEVQIDYEKFYDMILDCFLRCCELHDETKGKFTTYFTRASRNLAHAVYRDRFAKKEIAWTSRSQADKDKADALIEECLSVLTPKQKTIVKLKGQGYTNSQIAELIGVTRECVRQKLLAVNRRCQKFYSKLQGVYENDS